MSTEWFFLEKRFWFGVLALMLLALVIDAGTGYLNPGWWTPGTVVLAIGNAIWLYLYPTQTPFKDGSRYTTTDES